MALTSEQLRALRWINEFPSNESEWTVDGKPIKKQPSDKWNLMKISGPQGSILIRADDLKAIRGLVAHCAAPDKLYSLNDSGKAELASAESSR